MISHTTERFRTLLEGLPDEVKSQAKNAYIRFRDNPNHPGLQFKRVHSVRLVYSVRISRSYRALGVREGEGMIWFWIGNHDDYDSLISRL